MKRTIAMLLIAALCLASILADDGLGVQVIGGKKKTSDPVSLEDVKLNVEVEVDGLGIIKPTEYNTYNYFSVYDKGSSGSNYRRQNSGAEADHVVLSMDITNTTKEEKNYLSNCSVRVSFDNEEYIFGGKAYQLDYDINNEVPRHPQDNFPIAPMYQGHYWFVCTLPNAVINSEKPLSMTVTIDGNEITYNIRK